MTTALLGAARETLGYHDLLRNLLARDLKVRYKQSALGFFWSLLRPLLLLFGVPLTAQVLWLPSLILFQTVFLLGVGLLLAAANVYYRDVEAALEPVLMAWFFATPIL